MDERTFLRRYPPSESPLRARHGVPPGRLLVGAAGRLSPEKGFANLIRAAAVLLSKGLDFEVWIAGDGEERSMLEALTHQLAIRDRVKLLGYCSNPIEVFHAMDLFVLSSLREGLPNVLLEAMAMRVPIVSTDAGGVPLVIDDGVTGLLCGADDIGALAAAMERLLRQAPLRERLGQAGANLVEQEYTFAQRAAKETAIYDRLLAGIS